MMTGRPTDQEKTDDRPATTDDHRRPRTTATDGPTTTADAGPLHPPPDVARLAPMRAHAGDVIPRRLKAFERPAERGGLGQWKRAHHSEVRGQPERRQPRRHEENRQRADRGVSGVRCRHRRPPGERGSIGAKARTPAQILRESPRATVLPTLIAMPT